MVSAPNGKSHKQRHSASLSLPTRATPMKFNASQVASPVSRSAVSESLIRKQIVYWMHSVERTNRSHSLGLSVGLQTSTTIKHYPAECREMRARPDAPQTTEGAKVLRNC